MNLADFAAVAGKNGSLLRLGGNVLAEEGPWRKIEDDVVWRGGDFK